MGVCCFAKASFPDVDSVKFWFSTKVASFLNDVVSTLDYKAKCYNALKTWI